MNNFIEIVSNKSDEELLVMVYEFAEWSPEMLEAVEAELLKRNILPADINQKKQDLIKEENILLSNGKQASLIGQVLDGLEFQVYWDYLLVIIMPFQKLEVSILKKNI